MPHYKSKHITNTMIILSILLFISDLIELTYDLGKVTRTHVLPALVYLYVRAEQAYDAVTSMDMELWTIDLWTVDELSTTCPIAP